MSLVCYDLAKIVIDDEIVERAFAEAIATLGIVAGTEAYTRSMVRFDRGRGRSPADILRELFEGDETRAQAACLAFDQSFSAAAERFGVAASPEVLAPFGKVSAAGRRVCSLTTLSRGAAGPLIGQLHLHGPADLVLCADDAPRGFPWPDLVLTAMLRLGAGDVREVAVVSATEAGLLAGHRAGAGMVVGVTRNRKRLPAMRKAGATHILDDIAALPDLLATP
ncbi:MAG: haloacid dehalogenase [Nocardiopsaceae bacterium]|nr:haloacid dehalogenase [Nocardiopsaceae bacterium]